MTGKQDNDQGHPFNRSYRSSILNGGGSLGLQPKGGRGSAALGGVGYISWHRAGSWQTGGTGNGAGHANRSAPIRRVQGHFAACTRESYSGGSHPRIPAEATVRKANGFGYATSA